MHSHHKHAFTLCCVTALLVSAPNIIAAQPPASASTGSRVSERQKLELEKLQLEVAALLAQQADAARARTDRERRKLELEIVTLQTQQARDDLERRKLEAEIAGLQMQQRLPPWLSVVAAFIVGAIATGGSVWVAQRNRQGALDLTVHEQRIKTYPRLVRAAAPLALYFPSDGSVDRALCCEMGRRMSAWYFSGGGILLSRDARNAYFSFARALTRASKIDRLRTPRFPDDAEQISYEKLKQYRSQLSITTNLDFIEKWQFAKDVDPSATSAERFRDFVFLQTLSSALRSALAEDLNSRRRTSS